MKKSRTKFLSWTLAALAIGCAAGCQSKSAAPPPKSEAKMDMTPTRIVGLGRIEPELKILDLQSEVAGIVTGIFFHAGDVVAKDQTFVELSSAIEKARLEQKAAQVQSQRSQIDAARAALGSARARTENARLSFLRAKSLTEQDAQSKSIFDAAKAEYESLLEDIKRLEAGVVAAEDILKQAQADQRLSQAEYDRRFIKARSDGQILSLDITVGSLISPEKPFGTFAPKSALIARVEIDEMFAGLIQPGQKSYVRAPGMTEALARGKVTFAGPSLRRKSLFSDDVGSLEDRRVREIWITLDPGSRLLFGTRVEAVVLLKES
jgi:multidrug efflux pump subunit AcrA (membrane-fusion protein)